MPQAGQHWFDGRDSMMAFFIDGEYGELRVRKKDCFCGGRMVADNTIGSLAVYACEYDRRHTADLEENQ